MEGGGDDPGGGEGQGGGAEGSQGRGGRGGHDVEDRHDHAVEDGHDHRSKTAIMTETDFHFRHLKTFLWLTIRNKVKLYRF